MSLEVFSPDSVSCQRAMTWPLKLTCAGIASIRRTLRNPSAPSSAAISRPSVNGSGPALAGPDSAQPMKASQAATPK